MLITMRLTQGSEGWIMADGCGGRGGLKAVAGNRPSRRGYCPLGFISFPQPPRHWSFHHSWKWLWLISWVLEYAGYDGDWRTKSQSYSKSCLFTVGCTSIPTTPFLLTTHCSGLPPPRHMRSFSKHRRESGENPTHSVSCWHLVESGSCHNARLVSVCIYCSTVASFGVSPNIFLWSNLVWSLNNSIPQEEFKQLMIINRIFFSGQLVFHPTAHQSVILLDSFREHPAVDSPPSALCLQWTVRERRQAGLLKWRGMDDISVRGAAEDGGI